MKLLCTALMLAVTACAQNVTVSGSARVVHESKSVTGSGDVVVWLTPASGPMSVQPGPLARITQIDKKFLPHLTVVPLGTAIEFPNKDPYFHNVFSIYRGKPFDLGLYESGQSRTVRFTQPGVSYIFCNIHPQMSAVVLALRTPYFAISKPDGTYQIHNVPPGRYKMEVFYEGSAEQELASLQRDVEIGESDASLPSITLHSSDAVKAHLNKYGEPYDTKKKSVY